MSEHPRKGRRVVFEEAAGTGAPASDPVSGLRFTIEPRRGSAVLVDYTALRPRRLALAFATALIRLGSPGGPLGARSTVKAYAVMLPRFFGYLDAVGRKVSGPDDLRPDDLDGFEDWLAGEGLSRTHLFTVLVKIVAVLRMVAELSPDAITPALRDRLRYVSAKPFQRPTPRDALSPYVARQLRDAARADVGAITRRIRAGPIHPNDRVLHAASVAAHDVIARRGVLRGSDPEYGSLFAARYRHGLSSPRLRDELHGAHHLTAADVIPFLVLLSLETGLEIECAKALTVDCLRNPLGGTIELAYVKHRARGAEHKTMRVRDRGSSTPGGLIRTLLALTATARRHQPTDCLWLYFRQGALVSGVRHPQIGVDAWVACHGIVDDQGQPLRLLLSQLRKTHKALWYLKTEGHMARFAVGHTAEVAAQHYADLPSLRPLHEATVAAALEDALAVATGPRMLDPAEEAAWRADPVTADPPAGADVEALLSGEQDVWLASCGGFYASPFGRAGAPCPSPFWGCLECPNAVITARKLPAILGFLAFVEGQRAGLTAGDWAAKFGRAHARITRDVLPAFSEAVIADARAQLAVDPPLAYLPPEARA